MRLSDRDQLNVTDQSARFRGGCRDLLPNAVEIFGDRTHAEL